VQSIRLNALLDSTVAAKSGEMVAIPAA
jgi:hypothetical protein